MTRWFFALVLLLSAIVHARAQSPLPDSTSDYTMPHNHRCGELTDSIRERLWINPDGSCNWDIQRQPIRKLVIHHTETGPWASLSYLNRIHCENLYWPKRRMSTGHYWNINGRIEQTCIAYHRILRIDGNVQQGLQDSEIGWNSGNWNVNMESLAIAIVGTFNARQWPDPQAIRRLEAIADSFPEAEIVAHSEVNLKKDCPGNWFFVWRSAYLARRRLRAPPEPRFSLWTPPWETLSPWSTTFSFKPLFLHKHRGLSFVGKRKHPLFLEGVFRLLLEPEDYLLLFAVFFFATFLAAFLAGLLTAFLAAFLAAFFLTAIFV